MSDVTVDILEYGRDSTDNLSKRKYPAKFVVVSPGGGPRNRGYSSKARVQVKVICYAMYGEEAWRMSEAIYDRLNIAALKQSNTATGTALTGTTCILSILSAGGPQEANLRGIPRPPPRHLHRPIRRKGGNPLMSDGYATGAVQIYTGNNRRVAPPGAP